MLGGAVPIECTVARGIIEANRKAPDQWCPRPAQRGRAQTGALGNAVAVRAGSIAASSARSAATRSALSCSLNRPRVLAARHAPIVVQLEDRRGQFVRVMTMGVVVVDDVTLHDQRRAGAPRLDIDRDGRGRVVGQLPSTRVVVHHYGVDQAR